MTDQLDRLETALADRYTIEREIGRGGMATVYLAQDLKHGRPVALKVLLPELAATIGGERFLQEIRLTANLQHPHILPLYDSGEADRLLFYVMPNIEGESLRDRLKRETQLPVEAALRIAEQAASALDFAHRHDVIHRDIKPENILLHEGEAMVADFGIALAVKAAGGERLTETGLSIGTPEYMSPEQVAGERNLDARSDIYSLACVLFEMLAGQPPFTAATAQAVLARHVTDPAPAITTVRPSVPAPVAAAIAKALGKAPADRFSSASTFAEALRAEGLETDLDRKSIVVLPFENLSPDPDNAFFADGLTEEIIADLSKVQALHVISRTSAFAFKGTTKTVPAIAQELSVRYALEGSVRKAGNSLRITAQLIDAETDAHLWAEKYAGTMDDVFDVQESVSRSIVQALQVRLRPSEDEGLSDRPLSDVRAYECYLRARQEFNTWTAEGHRSAVALLQEGLTLAGDNPLLLATLAYFSVLRLMFGLSTNRDVDEAAVESSIQRLEVRDPDSAYLQFLHAMVAFNKGEMREAIAGFKRARERSPGHAEVIKMLGYCCGWIGQTATSLGYMEQYVAIDPLSPDDRILPAIFTAFEGKNDEAYKIGRPEYEAGRGNPAAVWTWAAVLAYGDRLPEMRKVTAELEQLAPDWVYTHQMQALTAALEGDMEQARGHVTPALVEQASHEAHLSMHLAEAYAVMGAIDEALDALDNATRRGFVHYPYIALHNRLFENIRADSRFKELMVRVKRDWESFSQLVA